MIRRSFIKDSEYDYINVSFEVQCLRKYFINYIMEAIGEFVYIKITHKSFILEKKIIPIRIEESMDIQNHLNIYNKLNSS